MKVKIWRKKAVDREEWASVVKEAKAVRGPCSQGVSKYVSCRIIHTHTHTHTQHSSSCITFIVTGQ